MLAKIERHLLLIHIAVFLAVMSILACAVFVYFQSSLNQQAREETSRLADSIISSIDFDEVGRHDSLIPDSLVGVVPLEGSDSLEQMRLQWFNQNGQIAADKGHFPISFRFSPLPEFQEQDKPHALILTRPAKMQNQVLGYVRVARPLHASDQLLNNLFAGLVLGILLSTIVSAIGIMWLVRQSMIPIADMMRQLRRFTADSSHELRSPIMAIKSNTEVALKYSEGMRDADREKFETIRDATNQMKTLTDDLLELAKLDDSSRRDLLPKSELVDLAQICRDLVNAQTEVAGQSIAVRVQLPQELCLHADEGDLRSLFGNILGNAFRYTPLGGEIDINGKRENSNLVISIKDSGIGISATDLPHVFDRFWRADKARHHHDGGNGLGLAIAKGIAEKYGGTISVESKIGDGSRFTVRLPVPNETGR